MPPAARGTLFEKTVPLDPLQKLLIIFIAGLTIPSKPGLKPCSFHSNWSNRFWKMATRKFTCRNFTTWTVNSYQECYGKKGVGDPNLFTVSQMPFFRSFISKVCRKSKVSHCTISSYRPGKENCQKVKEFQP